MCDAITPDEFRREFEFINSTYEKDVGKRMLIFGKDQDTYDTTDNFISSSVGEFI